MISHPALKNTPYLKEHLKEHSVSMHEALVWGCKPLSRLISTISRIAGIPVVRFEDGFLAYQGHPSSGKKRFSLVSDRLGIYYDASCRSELESLVIARAAKSYNREEARRLMSVITNYGIGKYYNSNKSSFVDLRVPHNSVVLIDQVSGDSSLTFGRAPDDVALMMIDFAFQLTAVSGGEVYLKQHPDILCKKKGKVGIFSKVEHPKLAHVKLLPSALHTSQITKAFKHVVTATSQFGFESLMAGCEVHCFGAPFYSHWGITDDRISFPDISGRRACTAKAELLDLFTASYIDYPSYVHPLTGGLMTLGETLRLIMLEDESE
ncbi:hypothetical protein VCHA53O466_40158 [Vibrio chagasii]|nr:hypothetical protein VCHA53O466_40158 [Vibrio chagasii]